MLKHMRKEEKGFTLIELLVVVVILGVLATMAIPRVLGAIDRARESKAGADLRVIVSALERYYFDEGMYPTRLGLLTERKYLKSDFNFKNSYDGVYFYAVKYNRTGDLPQPDHLKEFALGNPGNPPGTFIIQPNAVWTDPAVPLPAGLDPAAHAYWWGVATGFTPAPPPGSQIGDETEKPTRLDLQYD